MPYADAVLAFRVLAGCSYLVMLSSPSLNIYRVHKAKSVGVQSIFPLVALLANSHLWMIYGYLAKIYFPVFSCFLVGDFAATIYLTIYYRYSKNRDRVTRSIAAVVAILTILSAYAIAGGLGYTNQTRHNVSTVMGFFADVASVCLYCAPMERLLMVLKHKSAVFINLPMVLAGYANNMIWLTFGSLIHNYFMISINVFFFTMNTITLIVYRIYNPKTHPLRESWDTVASKPASSKVDDFRIQVSVMDIPSDVKPASVKDTIALDFRMPHHEVDHTFVVPAIAD